MSPNSQPIFYGLLYVDDGSGRNPNLRHDRGSEKSFDIYLRCAALCARSVCYHGFRFRLITNRRDLVENGLGRLGIDDVDVVQQDFGLVVPENLSFRSAHFKLELYRLFGSGRFGDRIGIVDIDSVMTGPVEFPDLRPGTMLVYDITDQIVPEFGLEMIRSDIERIGGRRGGECRWFGGEFVFGHAESFRELAESIFRIWPKYLQNVGHLHHVGDEMVVSAALPATNLATIDAGQRGIVARWWTARTAFPQMPFSEASARSILHLPSDKEFMASAHGSKFCPREFVAQFKRSARRKILLRRAFNLVEALRGRHDKFAARLS